MGKKESFFAAAHSGVWGTLFYQRPLIQRNYSFFSLSMVPDPQLFIEAPAAAATTTPAAAATTTPAAAAAAAATATLSATATAET